jgi:23S rRNA (uracil1939-C5)-methyltransferase
MRDRETPWRDRRPRRAETRPAERFELFIDKIVAGGFGLGRFKGQVVFVPETAPGDQVRVRLVEARRDFRRASLVELLEPSALRRAPPCPYFSPCGGCSLMHLTPEAQAEAKRQIVAESLRRGGGLETEPARLPLESGPELGYRARSRFQVRWARGRPVVGFFERAGRRVVDIDRCLQISDPANAVLERVRRWLAESPEWARSIQAFEILDSAPHPGRVLVHFIVKSNVTPPPLDGIRGAGLDDVVLSGGGVDWQLGQGWVEYRAAGLTFRIAPGSFFQVNRFQLDALLDGVVPKPPTRLPRAADLYCGVGFFTLPLARVADEVEGVESLAASLELAQENAQRAGLGNITFRNERAAEYAARTRFEPYDLVIVDPPRAGLEPEVVEALGKSPPRELRYVSCDPATLGRDLGRLTSFGLVLDRLALIDLFPNTHHVEAVAVLKRG